MRIPAIIILALLFSCQQKTQKEDDKVDLKALKNEVFDIHDEVMPKMGELRKVAKSLGLAADSIATMDSVQANQYRAASADVKAANESMMTWMRSFDPEFEGTYEERLNYLNEQKASISKVKADMLGSLERGQQLLEGNQ